MHSPDCSRTARISCRNCGSSSTMITCIMFVLNPRQETVSSNSLARCSAQCRHVSLSHLQRKSIMVRMRMQAWDMARCVCRWHLQMYMDQITTAQLPHVALKRPIGVFLLSFFCLSYTILLYVFSRTVREKTFLP